MTFVKKYWVEFVLLFITLVGLMLIAAVGVDIIKLTPLYILFNLVLLFYRIGISKKILMMFFTAGVIGYVAEFIGVKTGLLFGDYQYGSVLLVKFFDVPLLIGLMWGLVMLCIWMLVPVERLGWKSIPIVGIIAVLYDFPLEHFATRFDLWGWSGSIPVSNAVGWFLIASIIATVFYTSKQFLSSQPIAFTILIAHLLFFTVSLVVA